MTTSEQLSHLSIVQDAICDVFEEGLTAVEIRERLTGAYIDLDAVVIDLMERGASAETLPPLNPDMV